MVPAGHVGSLSSAAVHARRAWCRRRSPDGPFLPRKQTGAHHFHSGEIVRIRKRGTSFPARLSCGHHSLVSHAAIYSGTALCPVCRQEPRKSMVRRVEQVLRLKAVGATRPWGSC